MSPPGANWIGQLAPNFLDFERPAAGALQYEAEERKMKFIEEYEVFETYPKRVARVIAGLNGEKLVPHYVPSETHGRRKYEKHLREQGKDVPQIIFRFHPETKYLRITGYRNSSTDYEIKVEEVTAGKGEKSIFAVQYCSTIHKLDKLLPDYLMEAVDVLLKKLDGFENAHYYEDLGYWNFGSQEYWVVVKGLPGNRFLVDDPINNGNLVKYFDKDGNAIPRSKRFVVGCGEKWRVALHRDPILGNIVEVKQFVFAPKRVTCKIVANITDLGQIPSELEFIKKGIEKMTGQH